MRHISLFISGLFSLCIHGVFIGVFLSLSGYTSFNRPLAIEVIWEHSHSPLQVPSLSIPKKVKGGHTKKAHQKQLPRRAIAQIPNMISPRAPSGIKGKIVEEGSRVRTIRHYHPLPAYPWICRKRHQEGAVILTIQIDQEGHVSNINLSKSSGHPLLDEAALQTVKSWVFTEGNLQKSISIAFRLTG